MVQISWSLALRIKSYTDLSFGFRAVSAVHRAPGQSALLPEVSPAPGQSALLPEVSPAPGQSALLPEVSPAL